MIEGTVIRLAVTRLPSGAIPKPVWLWHSIVDLDAGEVEVLWQAFLRRFDIEHTFRMLKQTLGWNVPKFRNPATADRWTWLLLTAYTQLRLARELTVDIRRPWEKTFSIATAYARSCPSRVSAPSPEDGMSGQSTETLPPRTGPTRRVRNQQAAPRYDVHIKATSNKKPFQTAGPRPRRKSTKHQLRG